MARPIEKREHIEHGLLEVVSRKGLPATTIQDIADAANVSPGLLYRYWKSRDDLAADVYQKHYMALIQRLADLASAEGDVVDKLRALVKGFLQFADEQPRLLRFLLLSYHDLADRLTGEAGIRALLRGLFDDGMASGVLRRMDPDLAMQLLLGTVLQPAIGAVYGHLSSPVSRHFDDIFGAVQRALLAPQNAGASGPD